MAKNFFSGLFGKKEKPEQKDQIDTPPPDEESPALTDDAMREADAAAPAAFEPQPDLETGPKTGPEIESELKPESENPAPVSEAPIAPVTESPEPAPTSSEEKPAAEKQGFFSRLKAGLSKTSGKLSEGVTSIFTKRKLDDETLEELEDLLISADLGVAAASRVTAALHKDRFDKEISDDEVKAALAEEVAKTLTPLEKPLSVSGENRPHVVLMTGVNGAGKTTTIGKLAMKFKAEGKSVMLAAGDTFRAAAIEQLTVWGERTGTPVVASKVGSDAAGLAFDALKQAREQGTDVLLIDTAGRLQNKRELMDELAKIVRVIKKLDESAPHDTLLVLDATVGQNAISQATAFSEIAGVTGLVMTKLDGTARGGVLVALADKFELPIHFIGVGESVEDLQTFNASNFSRALAGIAET